MKGIDVSKWQGAIDWERVLNSNVEFAVIREGWGKKSSSQIDSKFKYNLANSKLFGIPRGVYHYSYADSVSDAREEALFCLENISKEKLEFPVVFDIEDRTMLTLSTAKRTEIASVFCEEIEKAGYYAMIYCNVDWYKNYLNGDELSKKYDFWIAQWSGSEPNVKCGIWQYTDSGKIDGIEGNVDLNIAYKDYPSIMKERGINGFSPNENNTEKEDKPNFLEYTVKKNDTLWDIALKFLGSGSKYKEIMSLNKLTSDIIFPEQLLKIPKI
ncbi:MAG: LysM peptidoglycan-binding domain-containing protein [Oscillospiraceae bacterium]|jgi:GH25 family lysozyme M1 (1,4-beta-N-acetylmuramidase)|nr:LysM peptidoglycan-binding domain-containing protein [Oscillospiraceae bacterium]